MQCQEEIIPYKRISYKNNLNTQKTVKLFSKQLVMFYVVTFFVSRAIVLKTMMPFGMALFIAAVSALNFESALITGCIVILGYGSTLNGIASIGNIIVIFILMAAALLLRSNEKNKVFKLSCVAALVNISVSILFQMEFISGTFILYDFLIAGLESLMIVATSYIFSYGMPIYFDSKKRRQLSKEEMVCLGFIIAIAISGLWSEKIIGISIRNAITYFVILSAGYIEGPMAGAAFGITLGTISGITTFEMQASTYNFGFCGMICGLFKTLGKFTCATAFLLAYIIISLFTAASGVNADIVTMISSSAEVILPVIVFIVIPETWFDKISSKVEDLNLDIDQQTTYVEKTKDLLNRKLSAISKTLQGLSEILCQNIECELSYKGEISGMVEKLADRVCKSCNYRDNCWKQELYYTYDSFSELLRKNEEYGIIDYEELPKQLKSKCVKPNELIKQSNYIYEIFKLNNKWRRKLVNSKVIVSEQVKGIIEIMDSMTTEIISSMDFRSDIEEQIAVSLDRNSLDFEDIVVSKNGRGKYEVSIYKGQCEGKYDCKNKYSEVISSSLGRRMTNEFGNCNVNRDNLVCNFRFAEAENYSMATAVSKMSKEEISGDSHIFGNINDGRYLLAVSDGMGSGSRAALESNTTILLLEKFIEAGFDRNTALKAINSVLVLRSSEECFATIDMGVIDLYSGIGEFIKIGSAPTFIKSGMEVEVIKSTSIPVGILDEINIESQIISFKNGDMIVMVTDGIVDSNRDMSERWITKALKEYNSGNPKDVADYIISKAKSNYGDKIEDDMTVIVSKIWKVY
jgi:stage II sporulation protein E